VPPYYTFRVHDYQYLITFAAMLLSGLAISTQTARIRGHAAEARTREARTDAVHRLAGRLAGQTRTLDAATAAAEHVQEVFGRTVVIFLPEDGRISFLRRTSERLPVPKSDEAAAQWAFDHRRRAGRGSDKMSDAA